MYEGLKTEVLQRGKNMAEEDKCVTGREMAVGAAL